MTDPGAHLPFDNLVTLVKRLAHSIKTADKPDVQLANKALDYLDRHGLLRYQMRGVMPFEPANAERPPIKWE